MGALSDPETWVEQYGDYLYRYALSRIQDPSTAEDLVQETLLPHSKPEKTLKAVPLKERGSPLFLKIRLWIISGKLTENKLWMK